MKPPLPPTHNLAWATINENLFSEQYEKVLLETIEKIALKSALDSVIH